MGVEAEVLVAVVIAINAVGATIRAVAFAVVVGEAVGAEVVAPVSIKRWLTE